MRAVCRQYCWRSGTILIGDMSGVGEWTRRLTGALRVAEGHACVGAMSVRAAQ